MPPRQYDNIVIYPEDFPRLWKLKTMERPSMPKVINYLLNRNDELTKQENKKNGGEIINNA